MHFADPELTEFDAILDRSQAAEPFKAAVRSYFETGRSERIEIDGRAPRIKVRRLLTHMLSAEPHLPIERIVLRAQSGCSDFVGTVDVFTATGTQVYEFVWDCRWRAEQEGWSDCFGLPDQIRAAEEFGWRCFARWEPVRR